MKARLRQFAMPATDSGKALANAEADLAPTHGLASPEELAPPPRDTRHHPRRPPDTAGLPRHGPLTSGATPQ